VSQHTAAGANGLMSLTVLVSSIPSTLIHKVIPNTICSLISVFRISAPGDAKTENIWPSKNATLTQ
jgi:hypothetical protein